MMSEVKKGHLYALDQLIGTGCGLSVVKERSPNTVLAYSCPSVRSLLCGVPLQLCKCRYKERRERQYSEILLSILSKNNNLIKTFIKPDF